MEILRQQQLLVDVESTLELVGDTSVVVAAAAYIIGAAVGLAGIKLLFEPAELQQDSEKYIYFFHCFLNVLISRHAAFLSLFSNLFFVKCPTNNIFIFSQMCYVKMASQRVTGYFNHLRNAGFTLVGTCKFQ